MRISEVLGNVSATNYQRLEESPAGKDTYTPILSYTAVRIKGRILDKELLSFRKAILMYERLSKQ